MKLHEGTIYNPADLLDVEANSRYRETVDALAFEIVAPPNLLKIESVLIDMILASGHPYDASPLFVNPENLERLALLQDEFFYFNRDCQVYSYSHRFELDGRLIEQHPLVPLHAQYIARPSRFDFKAMNPSYDPTIEPVIVSELFVFSHTDEDGDDIVEVVDLYTPLKDCDIVLHTPTLN